MINKQYIKNIFNPAANIIMEATMKTQPKYNSGFTLIELMIAVAIIAIIAAIAVPAYNNYISTARQTEGMDDLTTLRLAQIEFFYENDTFFQGANTATLVGAAGSNGRWAPSSWNNVGGDQTLLNFMYVVGPGATGDIATSYTATATGQNQVPNTVVLTITN